MTESHRLASPYGPPWVGPHRVAQAPGDRDGGDERADHL